MKSHKFIKLIIMVLIVTSTGIAFSQEEILAVRELILCRQVSDEGPEGVTDNFMEDTGSICCQTEISGLKGWSKVIHVWYYGNSKRATVTLPLNPENNTVNSGIEVKPSWLGLWTVKILDGKKNELAARSFFIKGIPDKPERKKKSRKVAYANMGLNVKIKSELKISEIKIGKKIRRKKLAGEAKVIPASWKKVYCWVNLPEVKKKSRIKFVWYYFRKKMAETVVRISPPASTVWAFKNLRPQYVGDWCVEVLDEKDLFILEKCFKIK